MAIGDYFGDRGPRIRYTTGTLEGAVRAGGAVAAEERLVAQARALDLARQIEELLEETRSSAGGFEPNDDRTHSTRMARAMAASLVDELEALVVPSRRAASA